MGVGLLGNPFKTKHFPPFCLPLGVGFPKVGVVGLLEPEIPLDPPSEEKIDASVLDATPASRRPLSQLGNLFTSEREQSGHRQHPLPMPFIIKHFLRCHRCQARAASKMQIYKNSPCFQGAGRGFEKRRRGDM